LLFFVHVIDVKLNSAVDTSQ